VLVLLPIAACYRPTYSDCAIACGSVGCPVGLSCVDGFCRTSNAELANRCVDAPPGDLDGDTIADDVDNCPQISNTDQANEDGDMLGDACDPCPPFADDNNDGDGDGVGNGCDPNPALKGDVIVLFEGFHSPPTDAEITGNWMFMDDQARTSDSTLDSSISDIVWTRTVPLNETVLAQITISNLTGAKAAAGIVTQLSATNGFSCLAGLDDVSAPALQLRNRNNTINDQITATGVTGRTYMLDETRLGQLYKCSAPDIATSRTMYTSTVAPSTTAKFGLRAYDSSAHFDWVMVVGSP
jgi:hypothetical protein